jgi:DNA (cytosine-5)-methyltransferase 1
MIFGSVCSGIDAASVAWSPLGWKAAWFSEIEAFPSAVLAHHYPDVVNLGDMTLIADQILNGEVVAPDILVGGTPCQAFSVAGARKGLADDRGQLTIKYAELLDAIDAVRVSEGKSESITIWENVPGVLSDKENAFGCFLGVISGESEAFIPPGGEWKSVGCVFGAKRTIAWRVLDAQYFGVAQRRRRVFLIASARKDFDPTEILFEFEGVRRHTAPRRKTGKEVTGFTASSFGGYSAGVGTLRSQGGDLGGGSETLTCIKWPAEIASTLNASFGDKQGLEDQHINGGAPLFVPAYGLPGNWIGREPKNGGNAVAPMIDVAPCQTKTDVHGVAYGWSEELNVLEDCQPTIQRGGAGGRHEGVAYAFNANANAQADQLPTSKRDLSVSETLTCSQKSAVCYSFDSLSSNSMKSSNPHSGCRETDLSKTIDTTVPCPSKNQGGIGIVQHTAYGVSESPHTAHCLRSGASKADKHESTTYVDMSMAVRRLTPVECERLQGFPDNYTQIPWRGKPADECPDGGRYKALGNSMAVPCMAWIGKRVADYLEKVEL